MANIEIQNLPSASSPLNGGAYLVIKDGLTDKKATVSQLREIDISALTNLVSPSAGDLVMIGQGANTFKTNFQNVGLAKGTRCWFHQNTAPVGWTTVTDISDSLIGIKGGLYGATGGITSGDWQQLDHALTIAEMPAHGHNFNLGKESTSSSGARLARAAFDTIVGAFGTTGSSGGSQGHNHVDQWRPFAAVGVLGVKDN